MRICLLANYSSPLDESMKNTAFHLHKELSKHHEVKPVELRNIASPSLWKEVKSFQPHVIHYVPGPSILSFIVMKALKSYCRNSKTIMSAMHPSFYGIRGLIYGPYYALSSILKIFIPLLKPDLILVQSHKSEEMFRRLGCKVEFLPGGVDIKRFTPASPETKRQLRGKYSLDKDKFTIVHVGSFRKWRNVQILTELRKDDTQVLIIGSTTKVERDVYQDVKGKGCLVWDEYLENVEELYQLADCYVFPTLDERGSVELPLSVLEAMACNLPVVSTSFGALPRLFKSGDGLIFAETEEELLRAIDKVRDGDLPIRTREMVLPYHRENVAGRLQEIYADVVCGGK